MSWLQHVVTALPAVEPVSDVEARLQVGLEPDDTSRDVELGMYIPQARDYVEAYTGQKLITQTVLLRCSCWADLALLPVAPIQSITSITYLDADGNEQTLDPSVYEAVLVGRRPEIRLAIGQTFPSVRSASDAIRVTVVAGYGDAAALSAAKPRIKGALLLLIGEWFEYREDSASDPVTGIPNGVARLLADECL